MYAFNDFGEEDIEYVQSFVRTELLQILSDKFHKANRVLGENVKNNFFGFYVADIANFRFTPQEKTDIKTIADKLVEDIELDKTQHEKISIGWKTAQKWYFDEPDHADTIATCKETKTSESMNLLTEMMANAAINAQRSKNGYRYTDRIRRFAANIRCIAGPLAYRTLQGNAVSAIPSINSLNEYIYRPDHMIVEGMLRCDELKVYLEENKLPLWVSLSEGGTRIDNRIQYDSRTNQLIGFVLPLNGKTGLPQPIAYKARTAVEMLHHFSNGTSVSHFVNTIIAKPIGSSTSFCLLLFGCNNKYTADEVSKRWIYIEQQLKQQGIGVLTISSDSDPRFNAGMRMNSKLGCDSIVFSESNLFKCGMNEHAPFYVQDSPHITTKLRNLLLKTIKDPELFQFGKYFVKMQHLQYLVDNEINIC